MWDNHKLLFRKQLAVPRKETTQNLSNNHNYCSMEFDNGWLVKSCWYRDILFSL
jgi:hypothetical protein